MELRVDRTRGLRRDAGNALELLRGRVEQPFRRAEVLEQRAPPHRPDPFELVEHRLAGRGDAPRAVEREREAVRFVANALEELESRRMLREHDRVGTARDE